MKTKNGWQPASARVTSPTGSIEKLRPALVRDLDPLHTLVVDFDDGTGAFCIDFERSPLALVSPDGPPTVSVRLFRDDLVVAGRVVRIEGEWGIEAAAHAARVALAGFVPFPLLVDVEDVRSLAEDQS